MLLSQISGDEAVHTVVIQSQNKITVGDFFQSQFKMAAKINIR